MKRSIRAMLGLAFLFALPSLTSCTVAPTQPEVIETEKVVIVPVSKALTNPVSVTWPARVCSLEGKPVICNRDLAALVKRLLLGLNTANERLHSISELGSEGSAEGAPDPPAR